MAIQTTPPLILKSRIPSPAIVAQDAVRRLPRWALLALCTAYLLSGIVWREPWRNEDLAGFGLLLDTVGTSTSAWFFVRTLAALLLGFIFITAWYATYYLARRDAAQPVPFAFGGEAKPTDYARAIADGALLALIASLGLAQMGHETSLALVQMALVTLGFLSLSVYRYHPVKAFMAAATAITGLVLILSGEAFEPAQWRSAQAWRSSAHMLLWFAWPAWVLALIAVLKWHRYWLSLRPAAHIAVPLGFVLMHLLFLPIAAQQDRWFFSALPALAALAAFALPTLRRGMKSLIDLFTLFFFSGCAFVIWLVWVAMQTGIPPQPAANVTRLLPAFTPSFSVLAMLLALVATSFWVWLVYWRLGKHRPAIWMSMVLPAGGAALCWLLLMSLWLPLLDHARSYQPLMLLIQPHIPRLTNGQPVEQIACVSVHGLRPAQQAALRYYTHRRLVPANRAANCAWLVTDSDAAPSLLEYVTIADWNLIATLRRPSDKHEDWLIYSRKK